MAEYKQVYQYINSKELKENWAVLVSEINSLKDIKIASKNELEDFITKVNEFEILVDEIETKYYIKSLQNTENIAIQKLKKTFETTVVKNFYKQRKFVDLKILDSKYLDALIQEKPIYQILYDSLKDENKAIKNLNDLDSEIKSLVNEFNKNLAKMTINFEGENLPTIVILMTKLKSLNAEKRKEVYEVIKEKEDEFVEIYNDNFDKQVKLRTEKAKAYGFSNYRDFKWNEYKRTYSPKDVEDFCDSIRDVFIPIQRKFTEIRKERLSKVKIDLLDLYEEIYSSKPLNFFSSIKELKEKTSKVFSTIHPEFKEFFQLLENHNSLDFELRENKSPAMFTSQLAESGIPFVYLLAMNNIQGLTSVFHEVTHAIHFLYNSDKKKTWLKKPSIEAGELFPLSMELISMEYWDEFFTSEKDLLIAKLNKFEDCLKTFRMVGLWDKFQTWAYLKPNHTHDERNNYWLFLLNEFDLGISSEKLHREKTSWQNRPLIFRAPFYMIEYGIATLGAISIYKNYRKDKNKTIKQLIKAMKIGNTKPLKEIYKTAGVEFDFTKKKVEEIGSFLKVEIDSLYSRVNNL